MSFNFDKIKDIDDYTKSIVYGYIHISQSLLPHKQNAYYIIPPLVKYLITIYYYHPEFFTKHPSHIHLNEKNDIVELIENDDSPPASIYGNIKIHKNLYCNKFIWTFKVSDAVRGVILAFGIDASSKKVVDLLFDNVLTTDAPFYSYESYYHGDTTTGRNFYDINSGTIGHKKEKYGVCFTKEGTINEVQMEFDTKNRTLRYSVNGQDQGIAFNDILLDNNEEYTLAISMDDAVTVQLMNFKQMRV